MKQFLLFAAGTLAIYAIAMRTAPGRKLLTGAAA